MGDWEPGRCPSPKDSGGIGGVRTMGWRLGWSAVDRPCAA